MRVSELLLAVMVIITAGDLAISEEKSKIILGTVTPGGGFPLYGGAVAEVTNAAEPSITVETHNTSARSISLNWRRTLMMDHVVIHQMPAGHW